MKQNKLQCIWFSPVYSLTRIQESCFLCDFGWRKRENPVSLEVHKPHNSKKQEKHHLKSDIILVTKKENKHKKPDLVRDYTNVITKWKTGKWLCQNNYFIITWVSPFGVLVLEFSWTATYSGSLGRDKIIYAVIIIHFTVKFSELSGKEQVAS